MRTRTVIGVSPGAFHFYASISKFLKSKKALESHKYKNILLRIKICPLTTSGLELASGYRE